MLERIQAPVLAVLLDDERLAQETAALLTRAGKLLEDDEAVLRGKDVRRARALLDTLMDREELAEVRGDVEAILTEVEQMRKMTSARIVERMVHRGPRLSDRPHDAGHD